MIEFTKEEIINIIKDIPFEDIDRSNFNMDSVKYYITPYIKEDYKIFKGCSKLVIIPKETNYVIKIPFTATVEHNYGWADDTDGYNEYCPMCHAMYPITGETGFDYCRTEAELFQLAKEQKLDQFFAEVQKVGEYKTFPIYVQERCKSYSDLFVYHKPEEIQETRQKESQLTKNKYFEIEYLTDLFNTSSVDTVDKLMIFLDHYEIGDLHTGNYGYTFDELPKLFDYSSYDG